VIATVLGEQAGHHAMRKLIASHSRDESGSSGYNIVEQDACSRDIIIIMPAHGEMRKAGTTAWSEHG